MSSQGAAGNPKKTPTELLGSENGAQESSEEPHKGLEELKRGSYNKGDFLEGDHDHGITGSDHRITGSRNHRITESDPGITGSQDHRITGSGSQDHGITE